MMQVFNSLPKRLESFTPQEDGRVLMYVCGLTPYDSAHIGHARTYVSFDVLKRYLIKKGLSVYHIQNITDVDDKIIKRCRETGADPKRLTEENHGEALELFGKLHILPADVYPKVTENIPAIIDMISRLIERGHAYETDSGVYFSISAFRPYGALSGQNLEEIRAGARVEVDESKKDPADFAVWKKTKCEIVEFDSPWGRGRPGWHIECSAMSYKYAKRTLDIHGGARDLIFPHHENEIAQSEAALGEKFCKYWLHTGFLTVGGEKMSKSLGNFITLKQALSQTSPNSMRLFYLQAHYRSPLDYDAENMAAMEESVERIFNSIGLIREVCDKAGHSHHDSAFRQKTDELISSFHTHMENDLNTPEAIASLFSLLRLLNSHIEGQSHDREQLLKAKKAIGDMLWILGLEEEVRGLDEKADAIILLASELGAGNAADAATALEMIVALRETARKGKDYEKSDLIRAKLKGIGIVLEDKAGGIRWKIA